MKKIMGIVLSTVLLLSGFGVTNVYASQKPTLKILTEAKYDKLGGDAEGLTCAIVGNQTCFLDENGKQVTGNFTSNGDIRSYFNGLNSLNIINKNNSGVQNAIFIDKSGKIIFDTKSLGATTDNSFGFSYNDDCMLYQNETAGEIYLLNRKGDVLAKTGYDVGLPQDPAIIERFMGTFSEGLLAVKISGVEMKTANVPVINACFLDKNF